MLKYIGKRLLEVIPTTFGIILLTFVLFNVVGGSPAQVILGKNATAESIAAFNHKYGYDLPLPKQFVKFCTDLAKGDFGVSTEADEPVIDVLKRGVGPSLSLTVPILAGGTVVGLMLAMLCAAGRGGNLDRVVLIGSTVLMSVNYVVWVLAGQFILAFKMGLFPVWGYESAFYLVLPVIIGIISSLGVDVRFFRTAILDEIYKPYVRTARMKGLSEARVLFVHVLRNSLIPIVTYISLAIPYLFTGSLMLESFFGIPGLGNVSINAIHSSDMAVVRAVVVLGALLYQGVNLVTDLLYAWLDPRVRLG
ncbi:MAG: ABC transporter permease [Kiritimatiellae bacterium]|nr:ABC transporter permease [Kiritimatiellia bacterium]